MSARAHPERTAPERALPVARSVLAGAAAASLLTLGDLAVTGFAPLADLADSGARALFVLLEFATFLPLTLVAGLFFGHILAAVDRLWGLPRCRARVWRRLRSDDRFDRNAAAGVTAAALALAGLFVSTRATLAAAWGLGGGDPFATLYVAGLVLLFVLVWACLGFCAFAPARAVYGRLQRVLPFPVLLLPLGVGGLAGAVVLAKVLRVALTNEELQSSLRRPLLLCAAPVLAGGLLAASVWLRHRWPLRWVPRLRLRVTFYGALCAVMAYALLGLGLHPQLKATVFTDTLYFQLAVDLYQEVFDGEGGPPGSASGRAAGSPFAVSASTDYPAGPPRPAPAAARRGVRPPSILLVLVDSLRADHVGAYGYGRDTTPNLDRFAERSVRFERAYAQGNSTPSSVPSILASRLPSAIAWIDPDAPFPRLEGRETLLAEALGARGYATASVSAHWYFAPGRGNLLRGFETSDVEGGIPDGEDKRELTSALVAGKVERALEGLARDGRPFFLLAHFYDPHGPHLPCDPRRAERCYGDGMADRYDAAVRHTDHSIGVVLDALRERGLERDTVVVVTADHGEAFGEHNRSFHGQTLYDEETRVPLLIHVPGMAPARVGPPVALMDVYPTLVELAGGALPETVRGSSLLAATGGFVTSGGPGAAEARPVYLEGGSYAGDGTGLRGLVDGPLKVVHDFGRDYWAMYDLAADPGETRNVFFSHPRAARLRSLVVSPGTTPQRRLARADDVAFGGFRSPPP